jgi:hypothetical protein
MTDYKKYSLGQVENFLYDAMSTDATPQEIYDVIKGVVQDNYYTYKAQIEKASELLALLNGHRPVDFSDIVGKDSFLRKDRNSNFPNENTICDKDDPSPECKGAWNEFWEENYYPEEVLNAMCDAAEAKDRVVKWSLPVEMDPSGEYFVTFPDDLLEAADLKEGDQMEWIDQGDGSYILQKVKQSQRES